MPRKYRKKLLMVQLAEQEPAADILPVLCRNLEPQFMQGPTEERDNLRPFLGNFELFHTGPYTGLNFAVEAAGAGTAGAVPLYGSLLRACFMSETIVEVESVATKVEYSPIDTAAEAVNLFFYHDGILHSITDAMGNVRLSLTPGAMPKWEFTFVGKRVAPADTAFPEADFSAWQLPQAVTGTNTGDFAIHGYAGVATAFTFDQGNQLIYRNVIGDESAQVTDRKPTGDVTIEEPLLATKDFHAIVAAHGTGAVALRHGVGAGHIIELSLTKTQLVSPSISDADGNSAISFNMRVLPNVGNDDYLITIR